MDRIVLPTITLLLAVLLFSCDARPTPPATDADGPFPVPYWPVRQESALGLGAAQWWEGWTHLALYTDEALTPSQREWIGHLSPAGGEGAVSIGFERDFDGDGQRERVVYGAWARGSTEGNFVAVVRGSPVHVVWLKQWEQVPRVTVFTLKNDGSLWFGGGVHDGEVTKKLDWLDGRPVFTELLGD